MNIKNSKFKMSFVKEEEDWEGYEKYNITKVVTSDETVTYFKKLTDAVYDDISNMLYIDEAEKIKLNDLSPGRYVLEGEVMIVDGVDSEFTDLKVSEEK